MNIERWRGLRALIETGVQEGATAVQRVHMATANRPFDILQAIAPIELPVRGVRTAHDAIVSGVYESIRQVTHVVGLLVDGALLVIERSEAKTGAGSEPT
jgi:hypothetical protein